MATGYDITVRDRISSSIDRKLRDIATNAQAAATAISGLNSVAGRNIFGPITNGANGASRSVQSLSQRFLLAQGQAAKFTAALQGGFTQIRSLLTGALLLGAADRIVEQADAYRTLQNRLRTVTDSEKQLAVTSDKLFQVAESARSPIGALSESYTRFDRAISKSGGSQKESLRLTETVSKALTLSGASATESGAAMLQLSQAFNKGKLDGDEFRSVAELMPRVIDEVTKVLGISGSQIYKWSRDGKISTDVLRTAFSNMAERVDSEMSKLPRTIGQAFTQLTNQVVKFFGEIDGKFKISDTLIVFLDKLKNNLPEVFRLLTSLGAGFLAATAPAMIAYAALNPLTTLFMTIPGLIGGVVAYLTYFGDEIKITSDGVVTFTDVLSTAFAAITQFVSNNLSQFFNFDGAAGAQQLVDFLINGFTTAKDIAFQIEANLIAAGATVGQLFNNITVGGESVNVFQQLFIEAWSNIKISAQQTLLDIAIFIVEKFSAVGVQLYNILVEPFDKLRATINSSLPAFMGGGSLGSSLKMKDSGGGANIIARTLQAERDKLKKSSPAFDSLGQTFEQSYEQAFDTLTGKYKEFENGWLDLARKNAAERAQLVAKELENKNNPDASLRQVDTVKQAMVAQQQELLKFDAALDKLIQKSEYLRTVFTKQDTNAKGEKTSFYHPDFQLELANKQPELQAFSQEIIKLGLGMTDVASKTQSAASAVGQFSQAANSATATTAALAQTPKDIAQIAPAFQEAGKGSQSFFSDMQKGIDQLNQKIQEMQQAARDALQEIGSGLMDGLKGKDGKFDTDAFLKKAIPAGSKLLLGKVNEKRASDIQNAIRQGAPQDQQQGGGFFGGFNKGGGNPQLNVGGVGQNNGLSQIPTQVQQATQAIQQLETSITSVQTSISGIATSFQEATTGASTFAQSASSAIQGIQETISTVSGAISGEFANSFQTAATASASMSASVVADMQAIESAAQSAAAAVASVGNGGGGGGGFGGGGFFAKGGYTGDMPTNRIAGVVHGQEFVMPANATSKYRPMLEAMRAGKLLGGGAMPTVVSGSGGGGINVQIDNYGSSNFEVRQLGPSDIRIIAREESRRVVQKETGAIVASNVANPNSQVSKTLSSSTQTLRRR